MMLFSLFILIALMYSQIAYTLNVNDFSDTLYRNISKNLKVEPIEIPAGNVTVLNPKYIKRVELVLKKKYGDKEVQYFRNMLKEFREKELKGGSSHTLFDHSLRTHISDHFGQDYIRDFSRLDDPNDTSEDLLTARVIVKLIKYEFEKFNLLRDRFITPNIDRFTQIKNLSSEIPLPLDTDTPCRSQAVCDKIEMLMNLCSYIRGGVGFAYDIFSTMVHVLGNMISVLCGCLFIGPAQVCLLKNFPYTCRIPYPAFSQIFQSTYSVWELVKISTNLCRVYGDIGFASSFG